MKITATHPLPFLLSRNKCDPLLKYLIYPIALLARVITGARFQRVPIYIGI
jgi:hypothetical protein